jgi:hypothetical protein
LTALLGWGRFPPLHSLRLILFDLAGHLARHRALARCVWRGFRVWLCTAPPEAFISCFGLPNTRSQNRQCLQFYGPSAVLEQIAIDRGTSTPSRVELPLWASPQIAGASPDWAFCRHQGVYRHACSLIRLNRPEAVFQSLELAVSGVRRISKRDS